MLVSTGSRMFCLLKLYLLKAIVVHMASIHTSWDLEVKPKLIVDKYFLVITSS